MLVDVLARYLSERYSFQERQALAASDAGWSQAHWRTLAELGVVAALFPPEADGLGGSGFDVGAVFEQLGRALSLEPFLPVLMAGRILAGGGSAHLLEAAMAGSSVLSVAHEEAASRGDLAWVETTARPDAGCWRLSGTKVAVPALGAAGHVVVSARLRGPSDSASGIGLFIVEAGAAGATVQDYPFIDGGRGGDLRLQDVSATLLHGPVIAYDRLEEATAVGLTALTWEAVGIMDVIREATLEHLRTRRQFGAPIGSFQVLRHRIASLALEIEAARSAAINAAAALDGPRLARERAVSAAKVTIGRVGSLVAEDAIQLHGAIGMTWELPLSHYAKRLVMIGHQLGDEDLHLERYVAFARAAPA